jgi:hypothetical protein
VRRFVAAVALSTIIAPQLRAQATPDTLAKPAVIYTYPGGRSTTDSVRVLQRPFETPTRRRATPPGVTTVRPETLHVAIPDSVVRWMKNTVDGALSAGGHRGMVIGEPRVKGDTAWVPAQREP